MAGSGGLSCLQPSGPAEQAVFSSRTYQQKLPQTYHLDSDLMQVIDKEYANSLLFNCIKINGDVVQLV